MRRVGTWVVLMTNTLFRLTVLKRSTKHPSVLLFIYWYWTEYIVIRFLLTIWAKQIIRIIICFWQRQKDVASFHLLCIYSISRVYIYLFTLHIYLYIYPNEYNLKLTWKKNELFSFFKNYWSFPFNVVSLPNQNLQREDEWVKSSLYKNA